MSSETRWGPGYYVEVYRALVKQGVGLMMQYRFAMLIWAVWGFVGPLVSLAVWTAATAGKGAITNPAGGVTFDRADFAAYFLTYMVFGHITMSWEAFEFSYRVRTGSLSPHLLKPIHPIHSDASRNAGFKLVTSAMLLPVWLALILILKPAAPASMLQLALAVPALALAVVMRYLIQYCLALVAFWTTRVEALNQFYFTLDAFLAGRIAPLGLLPGWLGVAAYILPFRGMGAFPVELALGRVPPGEILPGFVLQLVWLAVAAAGFRALWAAGVRQYSAVGA
jgi:ABC-2 type transport system permease protein